MSDVEKAKALLQAVGLSGVSVGEAPETVTVSRAELEALRAGSAPAGLTPGQEYVRQQEAAAAQAAAAQLPAGIMTAEEMAAHENQPLPKGWAEQKQQMEQGERYIKSFEYHTLNGPA
jgi:hypothetical protein